MKRFRHFFLPTWLSLCALSFAQTPPVSSRSHFLVPGDSIWIELTLQSGDEIEWNLQLAQISGEALQTKLSFLSELEGLQWTKTYGADPVDIRDKVKVSKDAKYRFVVTSDGKKGRLADLLVWPKLSEKNRENFPIPTVQKKVETFSAGDRYAVEYEFILRDTTSFNTLVNLELPLDLIKMWAVTPMGDSLAFRPSVKRWFGKSGTMSFGESSRTKGGRITLRLDRDIPEGGEVIVYAAPGSKPPKWLPGTVRILTTLEHMPWQAVVVPPLKIARQDLLSKPADPPRAKYAAQALRIQGLDTTTIAELTKVYVDRDSLAALRRVRLATISGYDTSFLKLNLAFQPPDLQVVLTQSLVEGGEPIERTVHWFVGTSLEERGPAKLHRWLYEEARVSLPNAPSELFWNGRVLPLKPNMATFAATDVSNPDELTLNPVQAVRPNQFEFEGKSYNDSSRAVFGLFLENNSNDTLYLVYRVERPLDRSAIAMFTRWPKAAKIAISIGGVLGLIGLYALYELRQRDRRRRKAAEELAQELDQARQVQLKLLPKGPMDVKGLQILGLHQSMQSVGGDYYDFFPMDDGRVLVCVADVAGHGLAAAMLMSNVQATLRAITGTKKSVNDMVTYLNQEITKRTSPDRFVTLLLAEISADRKQITVCNAGHNAGYIVRKNGRIIELDAGGIMLGVMESFPFIHMEYELQPGDIIAFYTDGIPEAEIGHEDMFGYERLQYFLSEHRDSKLMDIAQKLFRRVAPNENAAIADDMAMVLVRVTMEEH